MRLYVLFLWHPQFRSNTPSMPREQGAMRLHAVTASHSACCKTSRSAGTGPSHLLRTTMLGLKNGMKSMHPRRSSSLHLTDADQHCIVLVIQCQLFSRAAAVSKRHAETPGRAALKLLLLQRQTAEEMRVRLDWSAPFRSLGVIGGQRQPELSYSSACSCFRRYCNGKGTTTNNRKVSTCRICNGRTQVDCSSCNGTGLRYPRGKNPPRAPSALRLKDIPTFGSMPNFVNQI